MRQILRSFLKWLDTRFPEKVVITQEQFLKMKETVEVSSATLNNQEARLIRIEGEINKFNVAMGFGATMSTPMKSFQR